MIENDVWTWAAVALVAGPVLAGLAIPVMRWIFADGRRMALLLVLVATISYFYLQN
jgi:hypothetical protein